MNTQPLFVPPRLPRPWKALLFTVRIDTAQGERDVAAFPGGIEALAEADLLARSYEEMGFTAHVRIGVVREDPDAASVLEMEAE